MIPSKPVQDFLFLNIFFQRTRRLTHALLLRHLRPPVSDFRPSHDDGSISSPSLLHHSRPPVTEASGYRQHQVENSGSLTEEKMAAENVPAIGMDLGTVYYCVGVWEDNNVKFIDDDYGKQRTPSYVAFADAGMLVGRNAREQVVRNPMNTIFDVKRFIGKSLEDDDVKDDVRHWKFNVNRGANGTPEFVVQFLGEEKRLSPEEISPMILGKMKDMVERYLKKTVEDVVIAVPACFTNSQRRAMMNAAKVVGLKATRIINEPTAAALGYYVREKDISWVEDNVLIFDLGGGTFDVSLIRYDTGFVTVKATAGDNHLGGEDFTNNLVRHFLHEIYSKHNKEISDNLGGLRKLRNSCERAKRTLSFYPIATIEIDLLDENLDFFSTIARPTFEEINSDLFETCIELVEHCLQIARISKSEVNKVVLVGGSTKIPKVQQLLHDFFDQRQLWEDIYPSQLVAYGTTVQAVLTSSKSIPDFPDLLIFDIMPYSIGIGRHVIIPRTTQFPVNGVHIMTTFRNNQDDDVFELYECGVSRAKSNKAIGTFRVRGLSPAPVRYTQVELTLKIDVNGILTVVEAMDMTHGQQCQIIITELREFSGEEIMEMAQEARYYEDVNQELAQNIEAMITLEAFTLNLRNKIGGMGPDRPSNDRIQRAIDWVLEWLKKNRLATAVEHQQRTMELQALYNEIANPIQENNSPAAGHAEPPTGPDGEEMADSEEMSDTADSEEMADVADSEEMSDSEEF